MTAFTKLQDAWQAVEQRFHDFAADSTIKARRSDIGALWEKRGRTPILLRGLNAIEKLH